MPLRTAVLLTCLTCLGLTLGATPAGAQAIVADHVAVSQFDLVPPSVIDDVKANYSFFYGHTSHGSQIMSGLSLLAAEDTLYTRPAFVEYGDDLGHNGDVSWVQPTRDYLDAHPDCDVVMWSWCGGCSDNTEAGINAYLDAMDALESDYPDVDFVYMTGHLDGGGPSGNLYARNDQIRAFCSANGKILFDFADIESWDPDGTYYPAETDTCGWCYDWCAAHPCPTCSCAHSHCFNCYLKGKGFWWMMARVTGWNATGVDPIAGPETADICQLAQNRPNPFCPDTRISFHLPAASFATLEVFAASGQRVATLLAQPLGAGRHVVSWDGTDEGGRAVAAGTYFYRLRAGDFTATRKMTRLR